MNQNEFYNPFEEPIDPQHILDCIEDSFTVNLGSVSFKCPVNAGAITGPGRGGLMDTHSFMKKLPIPFPDKRKQLVKIIVSVRKFLDHLIVALKWLEDNLGRLSKSKGQEAELVKLVPVYKYLIGKLEDIEFNRGLPKYTGACQ